MNWLDWVLVVGYGLALVLLGHRLGKSQANSEDYYLAGRKVRWWQSGTSTMATQLGAISFVSAPAFVALKPDGGLKWLCYEFGVPLAMIVVMAVIAPTFYRAGVVSIYEYLERRFDGGTQAMVSLLFQLGRGMATAVSVLAGGLILSTALGVPTATAIVIVGVVTILYDVLGGIKGVILSDVIQMGVILAGIVICALMALRWVGWEAAWTGLEPARRSVLDFSRFGVAEGGDFSFWPMTVGGLFLYAAYYGCDQSQVQRELSVGSVDDVRKSLMLNAVGRFPVVLAYCMMGVLIGAVAASSGFLERAGAHLGVGAAEAAELLGRDPDRLVPLFILTYLPHGLIGFLFVAILSALMSSLDSALNSLSASTVRDFYRKYWRPHADDAHYLAASKVFTALWGVFCVGMALLFAGTGEATRQTTLVLINAVSSMLNGPILAAFLLGMLFRRATAAGVKAGLAAGVASNLALWLLTDVSWLWWNVTGCLAAVATALAVSAAGRAPAVDDGLMAAPSRGEGWGPVYAGLAAYFILIVLVCGLIQSA